MRKQLKILMLIAMLILSASMVLAIGLSPAKKNIDYKPGQKTPFTFTIVNNDAKAFTAVVYVRGELEKNIKIKTPVVTFTSSDQRKEVEFEIDNPSQIAKPGAHETEIVVIEYPENFGSGSTTVQAQAFREKPTVIIAHTVPGMGVSFMENDFTWHGKAPNETEAKKALEELEILEEMINSRC